MSVRRVLFLCSQNRLRSPTAEALFGSRPGLEVRSAGLDRDARQPLTEELLAWAELVFVMELEHRKSLRRRFAALLSSRRVICLDIPDEFEFMDPELVKLLEEGVGPWLDRPTGPGTA